MAQSADELRETLAESGRAAQKLTADTLARLNLPLAGLTYLVETGISLPARKVGRKRRRNLILDVPLASIPGVVLQAESLSGEFNFLVNLDRREDLQAVYDQPLTVTLAITDRSGRRTRTTYTCDYLVVASDRVMVYEIKSDRDLERLVKERGSDWILDDTGYHYVPATNYFRALGIEHVVVPISTLNSLKADNLRLLSSVRNVTDTARYRKARRNIECLVRRESSLRMSDILERSGDLDATPILQLIDAEKLFVDLDAVTLSDAKSVWVSTSLEIAKIAQQASNGLVRLLASEGAQTSEVMSSRYERDVATRLAIIEGVTRIGRGGRPVSDRTIRRYRKQFADANGDPRALEPRWRDCGNSDPLISQVHLSFLREFIRCGRQEPNDPSIGSIFRNYITAFDEARVSLSFHDERPVSRSTFYNYWNDTPLSLNDAYQKGGRRLSNEAADVIDPRSKSLIATRPFAVAHIDHWKTDLYLVVGYVNNVRITKRPWLTAMVDSFTGEVLALWLSFADPSKKSCTMVIRDCVRRHGRLPEMLIIDGGSDFRSAHFFVMLASLRVVRCERPPEDPRYGQQVERVFKDFKDRFARGLPGFGISIERARAVSAAFKAQNRSTLTLLEAFEVLEAFTFQGYNHCPKPNAVSSRSAIRSDAERRYPHGGKRVDWDMRFLVATSIEAPASDYKLWPGRGVHVNDRWYSSPRLLQYRGRKRDLTVRLEPFDDSIVYVCIDGKWIECRNSDFALHRALSDASLLFRTCERQDLAALRAELSNDMNRCAAEIVNSKLQEISQRRRTEGSSATATLEPREAIDHPAQLGFNLDDIEPFENHTP